MANFSVHTVYRHIFKVWRVRRFTLFVRLIAPGPSDAILDVGGYPDFWANQTLGVRRIDAINIDPTAARTSRLSDNISLVLGDACFLPMLDNTYDIVFSNSV